MTNSIRRGDIILYNFGTNTGSVQCGTRPAVVLQNDEQNDHSPTTIIAPITSANKKQEMFAHISLGKRFGLSRSSMVLLEQLQTVNQNELGAYIGHISDVNILHRIDRGLKKVLSLKEQGCDISTYISSKSRKKKKTRKAPKYDPRDIMCLCPICRDSYRHRGYKVISAGGTKDICDLCNYHTGFDYAVVGLLTR